jgi:hypothetical protein
LEANRGGRRHAFARAGREIPRLHRDPPNARRRAPRAQAERRVGTTPPARRCRWTSAPSIQVSCRLEIAEHSQYSCISRNEIDKKFVVLHRREPHWIPATIGPCVEPLTGESLALSSCILSFRRAQRRGIGFLPTPREKQVPCCARNDRHLNRERQAERTRIVFRARTRGGNSEL